jgi:hypothetical protein
MSQGATRDDMRLERRCLHMPSLAYRHSLIAPPSAQQRLISPTHLVPCACVGTYDSTITFCPARPTVPHSPDQPLAHHASRNPAPLGCHATTKDYCTFYTGPNGSEFTGQRLGEPSRRAPAAMPPPVRTER